MLCTDVPTGTDLEWNITLYPVKHVFKFIGRKFLANNILSINQKKNLRRQNISVDPKLQHEIFFIQNLQVRINNSNFKRKFRLIVPVIMYYTLRRTQYPWIQQPRSRNQKKYQYKNIQILAI